MDPFAAALRAINAIAGETIELRRGNETISVPATVGGTMFRIDTDERTNVVVFSVDFLIPANVYRFGGALVLPEERDLATRRVAGRRETYELLKFGDEPCWRWADPAHTEFRCHTKLVVVA